MTLPDLPTAALWAAAFTFIAVIAARIVRAFTEPHDPEDYYDG